MFVAGEWRETVTTVPRPYVRAHLRAHDGSWVQAVFLVDTGADCTVLAADVARLLGLPLAPSARSISGLGGAVETLEVHTTLRLTSADGSRMNLQGTYATSDDPAVHESILGYDVLRRFAVIVDETNDLVCLIRPPHRYVIHDG